MLPFRQTLFCLSLLLLAGFEEMSTSSVDETEEEVGRNGDRIFLRTHTGRRSITMTLDGNFASTEVKQGLEETIFTVDISQAREAGSRLGSEGVADKGIGVGGSNLTNLFLLADAV